jgi:N-acetylglutamate synthase-like GNAT family acetyltransferase
MLQPPEWPDILPHHRYYLDHDFCKPVKAVEQHVVMGIGTVIYHGDTAWLAHIIVHPDQRNKGVGTEITAHLVNSIDKNIFPSIYLIATDLGEPVYKKLGFETEAEFVFFRGEKIRKAADENDHLIPFEEKYRDSLYDLDRMVSGEFRKVRLNEHLAAGIMHRTGNKLNGFYLPTLGEGLIIANNVAAGMELMTLRLQERDIASVPALNTAAVNYLNTLRFSQFRTAKRMVLGKMRNWHPEKIYNRISGQIG